jgi:hypothetical protein
MNKKQYKVAESYHENEAERALREEVR